VLGGQEETEMTMHTCGGTLQEANVDITKRVGLAFITMRVKGKKCSNCGEETISRATARSLEHIVETIGTTAYRSPAPVGTRELILV